MKRADGAGGGRAHPHLAVHVADHLEGPSAAIPSDEPIGREAGGAEAGLSGEVTKLALQLLRDDL